MAERDLALGPRALYPAKALVTRARALAWRARGGPPAPGLRILFYHRVSADRDELAVAPARFQRQLEELAAAGLRGVDVVEAMRLLDAGRARGTIGLSFDDGYADNAEHALPVLEELGFTATVFVATGVTDGRARFTWYERQPPLLGWDEIADLDAAGTLRFEAHTVTHPNLTALDDASAEAEIAGSKAELETRLGRPVTALSYPAGLFGPRERALAEAAGFGLALSCEPGPNDASTDRLALRRIQVDARDRALEVRAKACGGFDRPPPGRALYRRLRYGAGGLERSARRSGASRSK